MLTSTAAFIGTLKPDHTLALPLEIPVGATVAVFVVPPLSPGAEVERAARFAETLAAARAAVNPPTVSDDEIKQLVKRARQA